MRLHRSPVESGLRVKGVSIRYFVPLTLHDVYLVSLIRQGFGGLGKPFHRRYVVSQAVQIMETAVVNNTTALATFREMDAAEVKHRADSRAFAL